MSWETIGLNEKAVNSDLGLMEYGLKGFRPAFAEGGYAQAGLNLLQHPWPVSRPLSHIFKELKSYGIWN